MRQARAVVRVVDDGRAVGCHARPEESADAADDGLRLTRRADTIQLADEALLAPDEEVHRAASCSPGSERSGLQLIRD